jgi:hypothetical protein
MREYYDFRGGVRGKYYEAFQRWKERRTVLLDPDVADLYPDTKSVNDALRAYASKEG